MESGAVLRRRRPPRLQIKGVTKRFGGVHALRGVDLEADVGEVHALLGENGAGKSTLMKIVAGAQAPDSGDLWIDGAPFTPASPREARERGVAMIYQELNLCPHLSGSPNLCPNLCPNFCPKNRGTGFGTGFGKPSLKVFENLH